jgi:hypothetical protein
LSHYRGRYSRQGSFAVLCEGDVAGYEVDLLEKWTAAHPDTPLTDVWPCGTKEAIFGMADAIGRSVAIGVVEDRDFRSAQDAARDCEANRRDRVDRGVDIRFWRSWRRHEIENYLLEPSVVVSALAIRFRHAETEVRDRLSRVIEVSRVDQAAQYAMACFRSMLPDRDRHLPGLPRRSARPQWDRVRREVVAPDPQLVEQKLRESVDGAVKGFAKRSRAVDPGWPVEQFKRKVSEWQTVAISTPEWLTDWAGKELLTLLYRWLSGEFGDPLVGPEQWRPVDWLSLAANGTDRQKDRDLAVALQPDLVRTFLAFLEVNPETDVAQEWSDLKRAIAGA